MSSKPMPERAQWAMVLSLTRRHTQTIMGEGRKRLMFTNDNDSHSLLQIRLSGGCPPPLPQLTEPIWLCR